MRGVGVSVHERQARDAAQELAVAFADDMHGLVRRISTQVQARKAVDDVCAAARGAVVVVRGVGEVEMEGGHGAEVGDGTHWWGMMGVGRVRSVRGAASGA